MINLFSVSINHWNLVITANLLITLLIITIPFVLYFKNKKHFFENIFISKVKINVAGTEVEIQPNYEVKQIAYAFWIELQTRKLGLQIDLSHDVIVELYNSWYSFFNITRSLIKEIPADKAKEENTKKLIEVALHVLNDEVRPHLTKWQARFRKWYDEKSKLDITHNEEKTQYISPQKLQRHFYIDDEYNFKKLAEDMQAVNIEIIKYKKSLEKIVFDKEIIDETCIPCSIPEMITEKEIQSQETQNN